MLTVGSQAPNFSLPDPDMNIVDLDSHRGHHHVVLYFYPKDDTPGCTTEAVEFTNLAEEFAELDTIVFGVSRDDCVSHAAFRDKHGLTVQLLADTEGDICNLYGVWQEKEKNGVKSMGIVRSTFIIDKAGTIRHAIYGVTAKGHAAEVLKLVQQL